MFDPQCTPKHITHNLCKLIGLNVFCSARFDTLDKGLVLEGHAVKSGTEVFTRTAMQRDGQEHSAGDNCGSNDTLSRWENGCRNWGKNAAAYCIGANKGPEERSVYDALAHEIVQFQ